MRLDSLRNRWNRFIARLTLGGRLHLAQPWMLALGPALLVVALIAPYRWLFFVAYVYILLVAGCYMWVREIGPRIELQRRQRSAWAQVGDELVEEWELTNGASLPLLWLEVEDESTMPGYSARRVVAASINDHQAWLTNVVCERRGVYRLGPLVARFGDPLGLFRYEWRDDTTRQVVIYPPLVRLPALLLPHGQRGGLARADLLQQNATPSVGGLREYVPGDLPSHIHWPTVARRQKLMVKEFDQERAGALWIALDLWAGAYANQGEDPPTKDAGRKDFSESAIYESAAVLAHTSVISPLSSVTIPDSALELAVVLTCSLAAQALAEGRAVGLLADDGRQRLLTPARGPRQLWRILSELVDARATGGLALGDVLRHSSTLHGSEASGAAIVVVTPALDGAWLAGLASWLRGRPGGALALLVARDAAQAAPLAARLATTGSGAQTFEVGAPLPLLNPPKADTTVRVSPLGRVIRQ